ncbi:hypothetical protein [Cupriavidus sp. USMAHM13]|uniref:hypothetical protein n=1 Tax=Cupriavidus sp. USMAHM13 TaxID=1389192 RepID=UPI0012EAEFE1|nr:hypothetical protein [Cupriavidus sp. USMAHM13]
MVNNDARPAAAPSAPRQAGLRNAYVNRIFFAENRQRRGRRGYRGAGIGGTAEPAARKKEGLHRQASSIALTDPRALHADDVEGGASKPSDDPGNGGKTTHNGKSHGPASIDSRCHARSTSGARKPN